MTVVPACVIPAAGVTEGKELEVRIRFPILEIAIVVAAAGLIYILERPQYEENKEEHRRLDAVHNLHLYRAAIEKYAAYNKGIYPQAAESIGPYLEGGDIAAGTPGQYPANPYAPGVLSLGDIHFRQYNTIGDNRDDSSTGPNGSQTGQPGSISVSWFTPPGETLAIEYGLVTFGTDGTPVYFNDPSGAKRIIVVQN
jgi:hypothetical protein